MQASQADGAQDAWAAECDRPTPPLEVRPAELEAGEARELRAVRPESSEPLLPVAPQSELEQQD